MSPHPEPPPYEAYGAYGGGPAPRARRRPSPRWFVLGGVLLLLGAGLSIAAIVSSVAAFARVEATVAGNGVTRTLTLETGEDYLVWTRPGESVRCTAVDATTGSELELRGLGSTTYTRRVGASSWAGAALFTAPSDRIEVTCPQGSGPIEVGERPRVRTLLGGVLVGLVLPILMAVTGGVVLLVTAILYVVRPARAPGGATPR